MFSSKKGFKTKKKKALKEEKIKRDIMNISTKENRGRGKYPRMQCSEIEIIGRQQRVSAH